MARAVFNGAVIGESDHFETVDGNIYFPPEALRREYFMPTDHSTVCGWKGTANYYTVAVHGEEAENVAWTYRMPKEAAANIKDFIAFYPVVTVET